MIRGLVPALVCGALIGAAGAAQAQVIGYQCGLTKAPDHGIAGPMMFEIDTADGKARVADPMTRFYAGGPVDARAVAQGKGWQISWRLSGVEDVKTGSQTVAYRATIGAEGKLTVTATPEGGAALLAEGQCWAR